MNARPMVYVVCCEAFRELHGRYPSSCDELAVFTGLHVQTFYRAQRQLREMVRIPKVTK